MQNPYAAPGPIPVAQIGVDARAEFIAKTYTHLLFAILAFVALEVFLFTSGLAEPMAQAMLSVSWLFVLGGFVLVGWIASRVAHHATSLGAQYTALVLYVVAEAIIFVPLLYSAMEVAPGAVNSAAMVTLLGFVALTAIAFVTRKDFSFLKGFLMWGGLVALAMIVGGVLFGVDLGVYFSMGMVGFAGAAILYDTSNVIHHFPEDRYVAASLELFASVALMLWYVIQLFMSADD
jgi:FtsH-binding integral membrane protein